MPDTLAFWAVTDDRQIAGIDFRAVPRRSSSLLPLRVKNRSTRYLARDVTVTVENASAVEVAQLLLSVDGRTFTGELHLGDLAADTATGRLFVRRTTPDTAALAAYSCNLVVRAGAWE